MKFFLTLFILYIKNANIKFNYNLMSRKFIPNQKSLKSRTTNYSNFLDTYKTIKLKPLLAKKLDIFLPNPLAPPLIIQ